MRLQLVNMGTSNHIPKFICARCSHIQNGKRDDTFYADLDGKPFEAYYCDRCVSRGSDGELKIREFNEQPVWLSDVRG